MCVSTEGIYGVGWLLEAPPFVVAQRVALVENMVSLREETLEVHGGQNSDINDRFYA